MKIPNEYQGCHIVRLVRWNLDRDGEAYGRVMGNRFTSENVPQLLVSWDEKKPSTWHDYTDLITIKPGEDY